MCRISPRPSRPVRAVLVDQIAEDGKSAGAALKAAPAMFVILIAVGQFLLLARLEHAGAKSVSDAAEKTQRHNEADNQFEVRTFVARACLDAQS